MPSNKPPVDVVQPGPGRLADGTVSSTALTFPINAGANAALQAHITDPISAHAASAISNTALGGAGPRTSSATEVQSSLNNVYAALNSQAIWVLDASGSTANSDYFGSSALITAMSQISSGQRKVLFLRPGVYDWDNSRVFTGVTIIADAVGVVEIRNISASTPNMRIGADAAFRNVLLNLATDLVMQDSGHSLLENVDLDIDGTWQVQSASNRFVQCQRKTTGAPLLISVSGSRNAFCQVNASRLNETLAARGNSYQDLLLDGTSPSNTSVFSLVGDNATATGVTISPSGIFSVPLVNIAGNYNNVRALNCDVSVTSAGTSVATISVAGGNNTLSASAILNCATSAYGLLLQGGYNTIQNMRIFGHTASTAVVQVEGQAHVLDGVVAQTVVAPSTIVSAASAQFCKLTNLVAAGASTGTVLLCQGTNNIYDNVTIATTSGCSDVVKVDNANNVLRAFTLLSTPAISSLLKIAGNGTVVERFSATTGSLTGSAGAAYPVWISGATGIHVSDLSLTSIAGGAATSIVYLDAATASDITIQRLLFSGCSGSETLLNATAPRSTITGVEVRDSATGMTSSLIEVGTDCVVSDVLFDSMTGVSAPLLLISTGSVRPQVRNVRVSNLSSAGGFQLVSMAGTGAIIDGLAVTNCATLPSAALFYYQRPTSKSVVRNVVIDAVGTTTGPDYIFWLNPSLCTDNVVRDWTITNSAVRTTSVFYVNTSTADGFVFDNVTITGMIYGGQLVPPNALLFYFNFARSNNNLRTGVTVRNCRVVSTDTVSGCFHIAVAMASTYSPIEIQACYFEVKTAQPCLSVTNASRVSVSDTTVSAPYAFAGDGSGCSLVNCTFKSVAVTGVSGLQLFSGWGKVGSTVVASEPLVIRNCAMLLSGCNNTPTATASPNVFLGGKSTAAQSGHGPIFVDGLFIGRNPSESFSFWHRSPILTIDTASQGAQIASSFKDITLDLEGIAFTGDATGSAVFADMNTQFATSGAVIELHGPSRTQVTSSSVTGPISTVVDGLRLLRLPRNGGSGGRSAIVARGVSLSNLTIDAASGTAADWGNAAVSLQNCTLTDAVFWPTTNIPGVLMHLFAEDASRCTRVRMLNFAAAAAEQDYCVLLRDSSFCESLIYMKNGSHIPIGNAMVYAVAGSSADVATCRVLNNEITFDHNASSASDARIGIFVSATGAVVASNVIKNLAVAHSSGYTTNPVASNGGCAVLISIGNDVTIENNRILYEWENSADDVASLTSSGSRCNIIGNHTKNSATNTHSSLGGTNHLRIQGGKYSTVSHNVVEAYNSNAGHVRIAVNYSSGTNSIVLGNRVDNLSGLNGELTTGSSDKPEASLGASSSSQYNQLT